MTHGHQAQAWLIDVHQADKGLSLAVRRSTLAGIDFLEVGAPNAAVRGVLLHGIGSTAESWAEVLAGLGQVGERWVAWNAPGYEGSTPLPMDAPVAADYAERMWAWLDAAGVSCPVVLVGHSLGALMAAAAARQRPFSVSELVLLSPARGYAQSPAAEREAKWRQREQAIAQGAAAMAAARGAAMVSAGASAAVKAQVMALMARMQPRGYVQAARMLSEGDLAADLAALAGACPVWVASGLADTITPPAACEQVARAAGVPYTPLGAGSAIGHACAIEAPHAVLAVLAACLRGLSPQNVSNPA